MSWRLSGTQFNFSTQNFNKHADYYDLLGVKSCATQDQIKLTFYDLAKKHHPDSTQSSPNDEEKFKQITAAYDILSNPNLKRQYDQARASYSANVDSHYEEYNYSYQATEQRTYTYRANGQTGGQNQKRYEHSRSEEYFYNQFNGSQNDSHYNGNGSFQNRAYSNNVHQQPKSTQQASFGVLFAAGFFGMIFIQLFYSILTDQKQSTTQNQQGPVMPGGRSPGSISAIYAGLDTATALEARSRGTQKSDSDRINELALKQRGELKPEKVIPIARSREKKNPAEEEIKQLRKQGLEVPKELLEKKISLNKLRHEKDIRKWNKLLNANHDAQKAFLEDIRKINKMQAEEGLPTISSAIS